MRITTLLILLFIYSASYSQKQNNVWCFGKGAGLDFNGGVPSSFTSSSTIAREGGASVCDRNTGALLFYTDGVNVWDRTHTLMPNGVNIGDDTFRFCNQNAVIVPFAADSSKYYIFTLGKYRIDYSAISAMKSNSLYYSVVDITLNGGLGDIVGTKKKIFVDSGFAEGMTAIPACDGHWLLLSSDKTNEIHAYKVDNAGVTTTPIISKTLYANYAVRTTLKSSPNATKLLQVVHSSLENDRHYNTVAIYDFDEKTGLVKNGQLIDSHSVYKSDFTTKRQLYISAEFSPDGSKLYLVDEKTEIIQFDLSLLNIAAIKASKATVYKVASWPPVQIGKMQLGPDANIYVNIGNWQSISMISNTNAPSPGCVFTLNSIALQPTTSSANSFPQPVTYPLLNRMTTSTTVNDTSICYGKPILLEGLPGGVSYKWHDGSTQRQLAITKDGTYWVKSNLLCLEQTDTFNVVIPKMEVNIGSDTTICAGSRVVINVDIANDSTTYIWQDSSTNRSITGKESGSYIVVVNSGRCVGTDTMKLTVDSVAVFNLGNDTMLCAGERYTLTVPSYAEDFTWSNGSQGQVWEVANAGTYGLSISNKGCRFQDSVVVDFKDGAFDLGKDTLLCMGDELLLQSTSLPESQYRWNTNEQGDKINVSTTGMYISIANNVCGDFTDSIYVNFKNCGCDPFVANAFTPNNDGINDFVGPILNNCVLTEYDFTIFDRFGGVIFKSNNQREKWDGKSNGYFSDMGTYYYMLSAKDDEGNKILHKGDITLLR